MNAADGSGITRLTVYTKVNDNGPDWQPLPSVSLVIQTDPPLSGLEVTVDGTGVRTGSDGKLLKEDFSATVEHVLMVPEEFVLANGSKMAFVEWSDGSSVAKKEISAPDRDVTLTLRYEIQETQQGLFGPALTGYVSWDQLTVVAVIVLAVIVVVIVTRRRRAGKAVPPYAAAPARGPGPPSVSETKLCSKCGATVPRDSKFCEKCGAKLV